MKKSFLLLIYVTVCMYSLTVCSCSAAGVREYGISVVAEFPHDRGAYTQGLFFHDGILYESTGLCGATSLRKIDLKTGTALRKLDFNKKYFGEGSVILGGTLYMLTWQNRVLFTYDAATLEYKQTYSYPRDGWGLTTDGAFLYASDGSSKIYVLDSSLKLLRTIDVRLNSRPLRFLNELEWIDGKIWANVYTTDMIVIINPKTGEVEAKIDCSGLLPAELRRPDTDVLNGIAYDNKTGRIYLTGKNWPKLYEIELRKSK